MSYVTKGTPLIFSGYLHMINVQSNTLEHAPIQSRVTRIPVTLKGKIRLVSLDDVYYFRAENKLISIITRDDKHVINGTLNGLEVTLDDRYIRVHRNALVSAQHISGIERGPEGTWQVCFDDIEDRLEISRRQVPKIRKWLKAGLYH